VRHVLAAQRELDYARTDRDQAVWRLAQARQELDGIGMLSQLRSHGRHEKAALVERIGRFEGDLQKAEGEITKCEHSVETAQQEFAEEIAWAALNGWRADRLQAIDAELAEIRDRPDALEPESASRSGAKSLVSQRNMTSRGPAVKKGVVASAGPAGPLNTGHGIDIGF
jgi:hypothetical protein